MFTTDDPDRLKSVLDVFEAPMFAAERAGPDAPFRMLCINACHARTTGIGPRVTGLSLEDLLPADQARAVAARYGECADTGKTLRYCEVLHLGEDPATWETMIQPVAMPAPRQRILGTAFLVPSAAAAPDLRSAFDDIHYQSVQAGMQLTHLAYSMDALRHGATNSAQVEALGGLCRSLEAILTEIRNRAERHVDAAERRVARDYGLAAGMAGIAAQIAAASSLRRS